MAVVHPNAEEWLDQQVQSVTRRAGRPDWDASKRSAANNAFRSAVDALKAVGAVGDKEGEHWLHAFRDATGAAPPERYSIRQSASGSGGGITRLPQSNSRPATRSAPTPTFARALPGSPHTFAFDGTSAWITTVELFDIRVVLNVRLVRAGGAPSESAGWDDPNSWFGFGADQAGNRLSELELTDDVGTCYSSKGSGGSGSEVEAKFDVKFVPCIPAAATELRVAWLGDTVSIPIAEFPQGS